MGPSLLLRSAALLVILLWMAPGAGAVILGHHLAEHHADDGSHPHEHDSLAEGIATALVHGHHHQTATVPEHEHPVSLDEPPELRPNPSATVLVRAAHGFVRAPDDGGPAVLLRQETGPPAPLFYAHCSLLL